MSTTFFMPPSPHLFYKDINKLMDNTWLFVHMMTKTIMIYDADLVAGGTFVDGARVYLVLVVLVVVYAVLQVGQLFLKSFCCFELNNFFVINIIGIKDVY